MRKILNTLRSYKIVIVVLLIVIGLIVAGIIIFSVKYAADSSYSKTYTSSTTYSLSSSTTQSFTSSPSTSASSSFPSFTTPAKTFTDTAKTVRFSYPSTWEITSNQGNYFYGMAPAEVVDEWEAKTGNRGISIFAFKLQDTNQSPKEWSDHNLGIGYDIRQELKIQNYPAYYILNDKGSNIDHWYVVAHNGRLVLFNFRQVDRSSAETAADYSEYLNDFKSIVNSVKFLN